MQSPGAAPGHHSTDKLEPLEATWTDEVGAPWPLISAPPHLAPCPPLVSANTCVWAHTPYTVRTATLGEGRKQLK